MAAAPDTPVDLVIRFSTSNPDLVLRIDHSNTTTALSLKQRIRSHLSPPASSSRLRLIHAGKVLPDVAALSKSLNVSAPPRSPDKDEHKSAKAKGKQPVRETDQTTPTHPPAAAATRVYIHCSVGDVLTPSDVALEAKSAQEADAILASSTYQTPATTTTTPSTAPAQDEASTTTPAPRGFDRLLSAGFTPAEVAALRTQFLAIQAHTHTPDTMPSGASLLALEESWLDSGSNGASAGTTGGEGEGEDGGGLEDMLYGNLIGFFWPVGALCWLMREEGVWTRRRQIAVLSGFLVNLTFGFLRVLN